MNKLTTILSFVVVSISFSLCRNSFAVDSQHHTFNLCDGSGGVVSLCVCVFFFFVENKLHFKQKISNSIRISARIAGYFGSAKNINNIGIANSQQQRKPFLFSGQLKNQNVCTEEKSKKLKSKSLKKIY